MHVTIKRMHIYIHVHAPIQTEGVQVFRFGFVEFMYNSICKPTEAVANNVFLF